MTQKFEIPGKLPGLNDLMKGEWQTRYNVKRDAMATAQVYAKVARIRPVKQFCAVTIQCYEPNARRDPDNVQSGANKIILDALQQVGILSDIHYS